MKANHYIIEDEYMGIPLTIEGELIDYEDHEPPFIVIQEITFKDRPLEFWCLSDAFIKHCQNRIFQTWCQEARNEGIKALLAITRKEEARSC